MLYGIVYKVDRSIFFVSIIHLINSHHFILGFKVNKGMMRSE